MSNPITLAFCRYDGNHPNTINVAAAVDGFHTLGIQVVPFHDIDQLGTTHQPSPEHLICGYICDVYKGLRIIGAPIPELIDYPEELRSFYFRNIWEGTLGDLRNSEQRNVFVKPVVQKLFTGLVWNKTKVNRLTLATYSDDTRCYFSTVINYVSEYRCFIFNKKVVGVKHYNGDWSIAPRKELIHKAAALYDGPVAYTIDVGIDSNGLTSIIEVNDSFAAGCYGLHSEIYARMIEARWEEMTQSATGVRLNIQL